MNNTMIKHHAEASAVGIELIGPGKHKDYRTYRLSCGHEQEIRTGNVRINNFKCQTCLKEKHIKEASAVGIELIGPGASRFYRTYRLSCGHEQEIGLGQVRNNNFKCQTCLKEKHINEASAVGIELIGPGKTGKYRTYLLSCGHEQEIKLSHVRINNFKCQTCGEHSWTKPSSLYLLSITYDGFTWLKHGYSKDVNQRVLGYGLPVGAEVEILKIVPLSTGQEANAIEQQQQKAMRAYKLSPDQMKRYHTLSGFSECFRSECLHNFLEMMNAI